MAPEQLFSVANFVALLGWLVLIVVGPKRWAAPLVTGAILPLLFAVLYIGLIAAHWGETPGGFGSLAAVAALFSNQWLLLAGWIHYLAFDLFIGSWQVRDARRKAIPHLLVIPALILTFLFGPAGLLLYFAIRCAKSRSFDLQLAGE
ncbi:MAG TPA: ABA4-like family protein [Bryobacteraceae bacterium]|nr:ABA4-like family protein [Bryobacteraceae bacterium]